MWPAGSGWSFLPNYNVIGQRDLIPAADLSEQISLAGKEASGTGNMKFALNGALTIGTLDGANIEIRERVGADNFFLFGLTADEAVAIRGRRLLPARLLRGRRRTARPPSTPSPPASSPAATASLRAGPVDSLLDWDEYLVLADYRSYIDCQDRAVGPAWADGERWTRMSILNTARCGFFSSDRTIRDYCRDIWHISPCAFSRTTRPTLKFPARVPER